ncbi:hypothetical protein NIES806_37430 [Dolichospermum compactum NIES-806]|uniref:Uncharacterized protein n=2 Tax=Dolichospermum compactum TaxID=136073 RepID=A0A1Z4V897_9CYAN|nr:hypothetical protein NIES806_37430 [Dolichospermum compactum NIES-806]
MIISERDFSVLLASAKGRFSFNTSVSKSGHSISGIDAKILTLSIIVKAKAFLTLSRVNSLYEI